MLIKPIIIDGCTTKLSITPQGKVFFTRTGKVKKPRKTYGEITNHININYINKKSEHVKKLCSIGILVADAFLPKPDENRNWKLSYIDGNRLNYDLSNLQWLKCNIEPKGYKRLGGNNIKGYSLCSPDGIVYTGVNLKQFCREQGLKYDKISDLRIGRTKRTRDGWAVKD